MSDRTIQVTLKEGSLGRVEDDAPVVYKPDSGPFYVSPAEFEEHGKRLNVLSVRGELPIVGSAPSGEFVPSTLGSPEAALDDDISGAIAGDLDSIERLAALAEPADHWRAAKTQVSALESVDDVRAFLAAEEAGKARDSVIEAAEARIVELGG